jgi:hypothetical protein
MALLVGMNNVTIQTFFQEMDVIIVKLNLIGLANLKNALNAKMDAKNAN